MEEKKTTNEEEMKFPWLIVVALLLIVAFICGKAILGSKMKEARRDIYQASLSDQKKSFSYEGMSFDHPGNWFFNGSISPEGIKTIMGTNQKESEFAVMWLKSSYLTPTDALNNVLSGYANSSKHKDLEYSAIYETMISGIYASAVDYNYKYKGKYYFAELIATTAYGQVIVVNAIAHSKSALEGSDFAMMKNSIRYSQQY